MMAVNAGNTIILGKGQLLKSVSPDAAAVYTELREKEILPASIKNFRRFSEETKRVCLSVALALHDAAHALPQVVSDAPGISGENTMCTNRCALLLETGIVYSSSNGALNANSTYFRDYLDGGRKLARANLFIYTLPSSPLAETAICFGLGGPLFYTASEDDISEMALREAEAMITSGQAPLMLALFGTEEETTCFVVGKEE